MTPTEQDKPINASDELRVDLVATPEEMCEHGVNLRLCNCHRCDGTAIYTEADRKRVALEARIETVMYIDSMLRFENIPLHPVQAESLKQYLRQLEAQQEEL